jgi:hypothetical protein
MSINDGLPGGDLPEPARLSASRLWAGGIATGVVAALAVAAGVYIARDILGIPVLAPKAAGSLGSSPTIVYALVAAACALLATGLLHVLMLGTPRPVTFFCWITGLADLIAVAAPFAQRADWPSKVFTAVINPVVGVAVISLLTGVARSSVRRPAAPQARTASRPDSSCEGSLGCPGRGVSRRQPAPGPSATCARPTVPDY